MLEIRTIDYAIEKRIPPNLRVEVEAIAPENVTLTLVRRQTTIVPADRLQPYDLVATPANGPEGEVKIKVEDVQKDYLAESPWIRGIKVFLPDGSSVQKRFSSGDE